MCLKSPDCSVEVVDATVMNRCANALGAGLGILFHTLAATFGLSLLIQGSPEAFWVVKVVGAVYLLWLGYKALVAGDLISFQPSARLPLRRPPPRTARP